MCVLHVVLRTICSVPTYTTYEYVRTSSLTAGQYPEYVTASPRLRGHTSRPSTLHSPPIIRKDGSNNNESFSTNAYQYCNAKFLARLSPDTPSAPRFLPATFCSVPRAQGRSSALALLHRLASEPDRLTSTRYDLPLLSPSRRMRFTRQRAISAGLRFSRRNGHSRTHSDALQPRRADFEPGQRRLTRFFLSLPKLRDTQKGLSN